MESDCNAHSRHDVDESKALAISKRLRFEVFKRDSFACQYCGAQAPAVLLHVDHIQPRSKDGTSDLTNLITACESCNLGKSNITLSDDSAVVKRKKQLDQLQERREQLELMFEWHKELLEIESEAVDKAADFFVELSGINDIHVNDHGRSSLQKNIRTFGLSEVITSISESLLAYGKDSPDGGLTVESVKESFGKIGPICAVRKKQTSEPYLKALYYIRGILRNRVSSTAGYEDGRCIGALRHAASVSVPVEAIQDLACRVTSWREFYSNLCFMERDYGHQRKAG